MSEPSLPPRLRVSAGTAAVLGLADLQLDTPPTTAYLMLGGRCARDCAFCAQARSSSAGADRLSRVSWPAYPAGEVIDRLAAAYRSGAIRRACLQVTAGRGFADQARGTTRAIASAVALPLCVSIRAKDMASFAELLALGVERVTLAADAACERVYRRRKGPDWQPTLDLLLAAARQYPGHVGTHVIAGLGETEGELAAFLQRMHDAGITTGLFAFTPVPGTALAGEPPPSLESYRRLQTARYLIVGGHARVGGFAFSAEGRIVGYGLERGALSALLETGDAFRTSGCAGCNRPYYNERPGGPMYNYPRPLRPEEAAEAVAMLLESLAWQAGSR